MPVHGFDEGKNKAEVFEKNEVLPVVHTEFDPLINAKQDKHTKANVSLLVANWSNKSQTIEVSGVTSDNTVIISPAPESVGVYSGFGVVCTAQGAGTLTFACDFTPDDDISVNVVILGV